MAKLPSYKTIENEVKEALYGIYLFKRTIVYVRGVAVRFQAGAGSLVMLYQSHEASFSGGIIRTSRRCAGAITSGGMAFQLTLVSGSERSSRDELSIWTI